MSEADPLAELRACLKRQDLDGALLASRAALDRHANKPVAWHLSGIVHAQRSEFKQASELDKANPLYFCNLGLAHKELGRQDHAIAAYRRAIAVKSDFLEARNNFWPTL